MSGERPMREAALELLRRQHEETGAPMTCQDPAVYAAVAKLLRGEGDRDPIRLEARDATLAGRRDVDARHDGANKRTPPRGPVGLPPLQNRLAGAEQPDRTRPAAPGKLSLQRRYGVGVLRLHGKKLGAA